MDTKDEMIVLQKGTICFLYRPKIEKEKVNSLEDVQRVYLILKPIDYLKYILIVITKKQLPNQSNVSRFAFVDLVTVNKNNISKKLNEREYLTRTKGTRHQSKIRILGEGKYLIVLHQGHTHLIYQLVEPQIPSAPQHDINISKEGSFIISIKNPNKKLIYPKNLQNKFNNKKFIPLNPSDFLNYNGAEILLIGQKSEKVKEKTSNAEIKQELSFLSIENVKDIFRNFQDNITITPISEGKWV